MKKSVVLFVVVVALISVALAVGCQPKAEVKIVGVTALKDTFKTVYTVGDQIDIDGSKLSVNYSDGTSLQVDVTLDMIDMSSFSTIAPAGKKTLRINYQNFGCTVVYQVKDKQNEISVKNAYLENMPDSFFRGDELPIKNGVIESALLCLDLGNDNVVKLPVKANWVNGFSTTKAGEHTCSIEYESDYGPVSVDWTYTVIDLASVKSVGYTKSVSIYQNESEQDLRSALLDTVFTVFYSDDTSFDYSYNANFRISGFSSDKIGKNTCSISFVDNEKRTVRFSLEYTVKEVFPVYLVTFNLNYQGAQNFTVSTVDGKITRPQVERNGYNIIDWYVYKNDVLSSEPFDFNSIVDDNITLSPRWQRINYTITIYSFGEVIRVEDYNVETERPLEPPTSKDGYTFLYYLNEQDQIVSAIKKGTYGNMILNAVWRGEGYQIVYDLNDSDSQYKATNDNPDEYTKDEVLTFVPAIRNGYKFEGWYKDNVLITSTEGLSQKLRLVAKWTIIEYKLTLVNGLTNDIVREITFKITDSNTQIKDYDDDNFYFYGWFNDQTFNEEFTYDSSHNYYLRAGSYGNKTIYAKVVRKYAVELNGNNNSTNTFVYFTDDDLTVTLPIPYKFGSDFVAWLGEGAFAELKYALNDDSIIVDLTDIRKIMSDNGTQKASFIATYNYHFNSILYHEYTDYAGNDITSTDNYYTNLTKDLPILSRNGYTFVGWYEKSDFSDSTIHSIPSFSKDGDLVLYAKWTAIVYTITVDLGFDDCSVGYIPSVYTADDQIFLPVPTYKNYSFNGWYLDAEFNVRQANTVEKGTYGNLTLYAKWTATTIRMNLSNMYDASYEGNTTYTIESGIVTLASAKRNGYSFEGWYLDSAFTNKVESFSAYEYDTNTPFSAYAKWSLVTYKITYVLNDNALCPATNDNVDSFTIEDVVELNEPTRIGYTFAGWFTSSQSVGTAVTIIHGAYSDLTLYARWNERTYTVTYLNCDYDGVNIGNLKTTFKATASGTTLSTLTRAHYTFDGWYLNDVKITKIGLISSPETCDDLILSAKWSPKQYAITLSAGGKRATLNYDIEQFVDGVYTLPTLDALIGDKFDASIMVGKSFGGWYKGSASSNVIETIAVSEIGSISLTAILNYIEYSITYHLPANAVNPDSNPISFTLKNSTVSIASPSLDGKAFEKWYFDSEYSLPAGTVTNGVTKITLTANNLDLYARFVEIYDITYDLPNGVSISSQPRTYNETQSVAIANPSTSLNFGGWWCVELRKTVANTSELNAIGNVTLFALVYDKSATPKLSFRLNTDGTATIIGINGTSTSLKLPTTVSDKIVKNVDDTAFSGNAYIQSVVIPDGIVSIGYRAFSSMTKLTKLTIEGETDIGNQAFMDCPLLKTVIIDPNATVGNEVFDKCVSLSDMTIGANKTVISYFGKNPYTDCVNKGGYYVPSTLTTIRITGNVTSLNGIFTTCNFLTAVYIDVENTVTFTQSDINALSQNGTVIYVDENLLSEYSEKYSALTFAKK